MIRNFIAKLTQTISERRENPRYKHRIPIKVWFEAEKKTCKSHLPAENLFACGETMDLSVSGISFIVPSIRIRETYLVGENRTLNAELDLPGGKLQMQIVGRRYEQVGEHLSVSKYFIAARILQITPEAMEAYEHFLRHGNTHSPKTGALKLEIDKG